MVKIFHLKMFKGMTGFDIGLVVIFQFAGGLMNWHRYEYNLFNLIPW